MFYSISSETTSVIKRCLIGGGTFDCPDLLHATRKCREAEKSVDTFFYLKKLLSKIYFTTWDNFICEMLIVKRVYVTDFFEIGPGENYTLPKMVNQHFHVTQSNHSKYTFWLPCQELKFIVVYFRTVSQLSLFGFLLAFDYTLNRPSLRTPPPDNFR